MNLQEIYERILKTTPLSEEKINLAQFEGLSVSQIWKKIDEFLKNFGLKLYCISSLDPSQTIHFEPYFHTPSKDFEYDMLGLRKLDTEDIVLFDDMIYAIGNCSKIAAMKQMLVDFYKRVVILDTFSETQSKFWVVGQGEVSGKGWDEFYATQQELAR